MSQKYVILRSVEAEAAPRMGTRGGVTTTAPSSPIAVELETMAPSRVSEVARRRDVRAVAPVIPMRLINPVPRDVEADPLDNGSTWGVKAVRADTSPFTGEGVIVAVLDTGIDPNHPAFAGVTLERKNFTSGSPDDDHGHGTHCAGTIFGRDVNGTRIGVAPGVKTALIGKVLGPGGGGSDSVLEAIEWSLQNGAHIISMSLGIDFPGYVAALQQDGVPTELATSFALEGYRANVLLFERLAKLVEARSAFMQAALLIAAAGNESQRDVDPDFEIGVSPPAVSDGIISVAALQPGPQGLTVASFSNVGARVSGPGVGVLSARAGGGLRSMNGTSMATPHVAGVAALWAQKLQIAGQFGSPLFADRLVGSAITDPLKAGFDQPDIGAGIVQAPQQ
jgi:subtilisin family serine protease